MKLEQRFAGDARMLSTDTQLRLNDVATFLLRVILATVFMYHGSQKLFGLFGGGGISATAQAFEAMKIPYPYASAIVTGCTEFFGGLLLLIGFQVRLAVIPMAFAMLVASFQVHWPNFSAQHNGMEYPLTLAIVLMALGLLGPGRFSLSRPLRRRTQPLSE
jgi:putative oxidoreductase